MISILKTLFYKPDEGMARHALVQIRRGPTAVLNRYRGGEYVGELVLDTDEWCIKRFPGDLPGGTRVPAEEVAHWERTCGFCFLGRKLFVAGNGLLAQTGIAHHITNENKTIYEEGVLLYNRDDGRMYVGDGAAPGGRLLR